MSHYNVYIQNVFWLRFTFAALIITQTFQSIQKDIPCFISKQNWRLKKKTAHFNPKTVMFTSSNGPRDVLLFSSFKVKRIKCSKKQKQQKRVGSSLSHSFSLLFRIHGVLSLPGFSFFSFVSACPSSSNNQRPEPLCIPCQRVRVYCCTL